jgi:predicted kinase
MKLTIMIGCQGSGKSTWAKNNRPDAVICSADDYFVRDGEYRFDPRQLGAAHGACFRKAIEAVQDNTVLAQSDPMMREQMKRMGVKPADVVIDNTGSTVAELAPYHALAQAYGCDLEIVWVHCDPDVAAARTTHGVPHDAVVATQDRIDRLMLPVFWHRTEIHVRTDA